MNGGSYAAIRDYGDALRRRSALRRKLRMRAAVTGLGCGVLLGSAILPPAPRLLWNASSSAPIGLYAVTPGMMAEVGDVVVARPPVSMRTLAATRHYLPLGIPLVKRVAAGPGDQVCAWGSLISIDGRLVAVRRASDGQGRPMPRWTGCRWLHDGQYFLLMADVPDSFDGRYFGVTGSGDLIGTANLLWRR